MTCNCVPPRELLKRVILLHCQCGTSAHILVVKQSFHCVLQEELQNSVVFKEKVQEQERGVYILSATVVQLEPDKKSWG